MNVKHTNCKLLCSNDIKLDLYNFPYKFILRLEIKRFHCIIEDSEERIINPPYQLFVCVLFFHAFSRVCT